ncbi:PREDICTED: uncharacterized protein LOC109587473 [Amphimedon queenslandica]|uniref:Uncharacterized protein n=1 Tax=Amphimedon queenslandica TaxID=400682 RepID=A0A1X7TJ19_AMPQE|nr:PREDICTED: uncharacterized protein LOC109587473 [Amphimedon queenslandica]|eukprot:XP_019859279.1 PREDICTED: uncharacterized protein LOC109587473 [Amphimedon queenslandica]
MAAVAELSLTPSSLAEASLSRARQKRRKTTNKEKKEEPVSPTDSRVPQPLPLLVQREIPVTREEPVTETSFTRDTQNGRQDEESTPPPSPSPPTHSDRKEAGGVALSGDVDHHGDHEREEGIVRPQVEEQQDEGMCTCALV